MTSRPLRAAGFLPCVPGDDGRMVKRAPESGAGPVATALNDSILPGREEDARHASVRAKCASATTMLVALRVNGADSPWGSSDLEVVEDAGVDAIGLPKATRSAVDQLATSLVQVIALVEMAEGIRPAYDVSCRPRIVALALNRADLGLGLCLPPRDGRERLHVRAGTRPALRRGRRAPVLRFREPRSSRYRPVCASRESLPGHSRWAATLAFTQPGSDGEQCHRADLSEVAAPRTVVDSYEAASGARHGCHRRRRPASWPTIVSRACETLAVAASMQSARDPITRADRRPLKSKGVEDGGSD